MVCCLNDAVNEADISGLDIVLGASTKTESLARYIYRLANRAKNCPIRRRFELTYPLLGADPDIIGMLQSAFEGSVIVPPKD